VLLVTLETRIGDVEGMINFCIPYFTVEQIMGKLSTQSWPPATTTPSESNLSPIIDTSNILKTIRAEYPRLFLTVKELQKLKVGDTLDFEGQKPNTGKLYMDDMQIGLFKYHKGKTRHNVEITEKTLIPKEDFFMDKPNIDELSGSYKDIKVQVITELGRTVRTLGEVHSFTEGTILELDKFAGDAVDIFANNVKIAKAAYSDRI
jgi:flagellar motor switch protein FliM